ncbi:hypothetical protein [Calothrix sp. PCC 7507]|uniref:hypothetical protein n=1 Tax=Calothrix sp. PCC 7507 TaxID=99598 RepID=UPI00029ECDEE|nr:hypothetical protein [Calothrix sp. PCC 7507]AFY36403.1 hypothetical protein Cal7507_6104 [Calothrix sp. PCC 7507]
MFDELFNNLKDFAVSKIKEAVEELEKRLAVPEPGEPFTLIRKFAIAEPTVTKGGIVIVGENLQIEAYKDDRNQQFLSTTEPLRNVILFEIPEPEVQECVLACRFYAKALNSEKSINISLGLKGKWTKSWSKGVSQTDDFWLYETRAHFQKGTEPVKIQISVQFETAGILLIRDIELLQAPIK